MGMGRFEFVGVFWFPWLLGPRAAVVGVLCPRLRCAFTMGILTSMGEKLWNATVHSPQERRGQNTPSPSGSVSGPFFVLIGLVVAMKCMQPDGAGRLTRSTTITTLSIDDPRVES